MKWKQFAVSDKIPADHLQNSLDARSHPCGGNIDLYSNKEFHLMFKSKETYGQICGINSSRKQFTCFYKMFSVSNTFLGLILWNW